MWVSSRRVRGHRRDPPRAHAILRGARPGAEGEIRGDELGSTALARPIVFQSTKEQPSGGRDKPIDLVFKGGVGILIAGGLVAATGGLAVGGAVIIVLFIIGLVIYNSGVGVRSSWAGGRSHVRPPSSTSRRLRRPAQPTR
jgi:hypothetical protein